MTVKYDLTESSGTIGSSLAAPRVSCVSLCWQETTNEHTILFQVWKKCIETYNMLENACSS